MNLYIIQTHPTENQATLRLRDQQGVHLAAQQVKINHEHAFEPTFRTQQLKLFEFHFLNFISKK